MLLGFQGETSGWLCARLRELGHEPELRSVDEGWHEADTTDADAWLVDADAPRGSGLAWVEARRHEGARLSTILVAHRRPPAHRLAALEVGPHDCLIKPIDPRALAVRLEVAHLRRRQPHALRVGIGPLEVDLDREAVCGADSHVSLTLQEWRVLKLLLDQPGRAVGKDVLERLLGLTGGANAVEFHVSRLRRKLGRDSIETIRARGYRLKR